MIKLLKSGAALAALAFVTVPALAQEEPEEQRTTYEIRFLDLAPGADGEWMETMEKHYLPARAAAGLPTPEVHWITAGPWDIMMLLEMPDGMATMDSHNPRLGVAFRKALLAQEGSEEAVKALNEKSSKLVTRSNSYYSHTHP